MITHRKILEEIDKALNPFKTLPFNSDELYEDLKSAVETQQPNFRKYLEEMGMTPDVIEALADDYKMDTGMLYMMYRDATSDMWKKPDEAVEAAEMWENEGRWPEQMVPALRQLFMRLPDVGRRGVAQMIRDNVMKTAITRGPHHEDPHWDYTGNMRRPQI